MAASPTAETEPIETWFVQAQDRAWGPYSLARLKGFVGEGRISRRSLVSPDADGPFIPAGHRRELRVLFEEPPPKPAMAKAAPSAPASGAEAMPADPAPAEPAPVEPVSPEQRTAASSGRKGKAPERPAEPRALLVWADVLSLTAPQFEALLAAQGVFAGVRPGLWLVRTAATPPALRNALSHRLTGDDALLVVEAPLDHAAWFNLDAAAETGLRQLWSRTEKG